MEVISNLVGAMLEPIRDRLYKFIGDRFGYLFHCKKNIKEFAEEVDRLSVTKQEIQTRVSAASRNAEVIHDGVMKWLGEVESMEGDKTRLLQGKQNLKCVDVRSRYRLGKEGKKKKTRVTELIEDGNNFRTVGHRPPLIGTWHRTHTINYESFESRELVFNDIMEAQKDDRNYKIGIHGMPGVGKTRMMEEVAKQAREDKLFDEIAKTIVSENPNLQKIQKELAEALGLTLDKDTEGARMELLHNRLKGGKRILLMVDDLWNDRIKLEDIGIPATGEHTKGCKILLTSRRRDVCEAMEVPEKENFQIGVLSKTETWSLFKKKMGDSIEPHEMHSIAEAVCEECGGLPLAILAVGGALKKKSKEVWKDALKQLKSSTPDNIEGLQAKLYSRIELSYNHLELVDAKSLFLLCCLFPEDAEIPIDYLVMFGFGMSLLQGVDTIEEARNRTHALVATLKTSSLLLQGDEEHLVKMHDVIRDVAISIASKDKDVMFLVKIGIEKWSEKDEYKRCRAISLWFNHDCVIPDDLECLELRTLILAWEDPSEVQCSFPKGMEKLVVLVLLNIHIATLPSSLKNLQMLYLNSCELVNLAYLKEFTKLEILGIQDEDLEELSPEIGQLTRLRLLNLRYCDKLKILPSGVISSLSQLEELYIPDKFDQWEVKDNASLNELNSLKRLTSLRVHAPNVELLPLNDELLFKSLIRFQISIGSKFQYNEIRPSATKILKLEGFPLKRELNILMEKAQVLILKKLEGLKDVFHDREREGEGEGFLDLKYLKVEKCDGVEHLFGKPKLISQTTRPYAFGSFSQLSVLEVVRCGSSYLFSAATARGLLQLQKLTIRDCEMLEEIISEDQEDMDTVSFPGLKKMKLEHLPNLRSFLYVNMKKTSTTRCNTSTLMQALFNHKVAFPVLEKLEIYGLGSLAAIWNDPLQSVLLQLQELTIRNCKMLEEIISDDQEVMMNTVSFHQLKEIELSRLPNLRSFYVNLKKTSTTRCNTSTLMQALFNHKVAFPALEELEIEELGSLTAIWDDQLQSLLVKEAEDSFRRLMYMKIFQCEKLVNVIPSHMLPRLQNLEKLEVDRCDSLLYEVEVLGTINVLPRLQESHLSNLPNLVMYIRLNRLCAYSNLTDLQLSNRESLRNVFSPSTARYFVHLQILAVKYCEKMEEIVAVERGELGEEDVVHDDDIIVFPQLKHLELRELPNLTSFCCRNRGSIKQEEETMEHKNISRVEALFNHKVAFPALEKLRIYELESLTAIWNNPLQSVLLQLQELNIKDCEMLEEIISDDQEVMMDTVSFNGLKKMKLECLPNLRSFFNVNMKKTSTTRCNTSTLMQALFNHKVAFPALEELEIKELGSLTAIWDDQLQSLLVKEAEDSFRRLIYMKIFQCEKLVNVIPSNMLPRLQNLEKLEVYRCDSLLYEVEVLGTIEKGYQTATPTINVLHRLQEMELCDLPNLVMYIRLKRLCAYSNPTDIHLSNRDSLGNVFSQFTARYLVHLQKLTVVNCEKMKEIVAVDVVHDDDIIVFPQLKHLELWKLPNLTSFCCCNRGSIKQEEETMEHKNISRVEALFNHKVRFPALENLGIYELKSLTAIWDNELFSNSKGEDSFRRLKSINVQKCHKLNHNWITDSGGLLMFHNLRRLSVEKCNSLRYLFSLSIARRLTQLEYLKIEGCDAMEEIVVKNEEQGGEEDSTNEIVFPKLWILELESLPKLTSFCGANNAAFKFPSLQIVGLEKCPELQTFASGGISTSPNIIVREESRFCRASELNKYVEQQYAGKGKGVQTVDNEDEGTSS